MKAPPGGNTDGPAQAPAQVPKVYTEQGLASWYGGDDDGFAGEVTASGEIYDPSELTCAHRTLPFGTRVEVENLANGRRQTLRVTDRGPFIRGRILDVSRQAAHDLGLVHHGVMRVKLRTVDGRGRPAPVDPVALKDAPCAIRAASLGQPGNVERLSSELRAAFGPVTYQDAAGPGRIPIRRIRLGAYPRMEMAQTTTVYLAKFCKDRGLENFIVRQR